MRLHEIKPNRGAKHRKKRLGSGESSGPGKTCGKGHKGQKSRSGASIRPSFEGGQMPLNRRLPKRGFNNARFRTNYAVINVGTLEERFKDGDTVSEETLREAGLVRGRWDGIKILGDGDLSRKLTVVADKVSGSAREKLEKAGGSVSAPAGREEAPAPEAEAKAKSKPKPKPKPKPEPKKEEEAAAPAEEEPADEPAEAEAEADESPEAETEADASAEEE